MRRLALALAAGALLAGCGYAVAPANAPLPIEGSRPMPTFTLSIRSMPASVKPPIDATRPMPTTTLPIPAAR